MADLHTQVPALKAGHNIQRSMENNQNGKGVLFLKTAQKRESLFVRFIEPRTGEAVESPVNLDWDDLIATDWEVV